MNVIEKRYTGWKKGILLLSAIISTLFWIALSPVFLYGSFMTASTISSSKLPFLIELVIYLLSFCPAFSCIFAIVSIWVSYYYHLASYMYASNLVPLVTAGIVSFLFEIIRRSF
jgi:hypothetical protein